MTSNLANVYATLLRICGETATVTYAAPPSYLEKIVGGEEAVGKVKVLFVYEEDRGRAKAANFVSPSKLNIKKSPKASELDLTGSPLKDECNVDAIEDISLDHLRILAQNPWKLEEECHKGISVEKGRAIICIEEFQKSGCVADVEGGKPPQSGSVWVLCRGTDTEHTLLLQYEFAGDCFSRGIITYMGVVPAYTLNTQSLLRQHFALIRPGSSLETCIENTYQIKPHIALRCSWSTAASLPSLIDLSSSCDVTLAQTFRLVESGPLTQDFMNQLRILMFIRDDILAYKQKEASSAGNDAVYRCGRGIEMDELRESINKVMTEVSGFGQMPNGTETECDIEAVIQRAKLRALTDLTDKLWDILKCCSSYKDLKMAFNILFQCAARCNIVNTPTNKNRLAEIITEVANRRLAIPCLTGSEPLELLLEIGLEKLHKDYEYIFTESKICSANALKYKRSSADEDENAMPNVRKSLRNAVRPDTNNTATSRKTFLHNNAKGENRYQQEEVIGFKNSNFNEEETAARLARLLQIHCILEHLLMIHINLNLNSVYSDVCEQLLKKPPRYVDAIDESLTNDMEISLSAHEVHEHLEGKDPHTRRITMKSKNVFRSVKSTFFFSTENIFPPSISESIQTEEKEFSRDNIYYGWLYRKIMTRK